MAGTGEGTRAVVVDPEAPGRLVLREVEAPRPTPSEAVVRVNAISLNRGEIRRAYSAQAGWRPGWDLAGWVQVAAADGSGPAAGTRVVGLMSSGGAWANRVGVQTSDLAELPEGVSFAQAATLPVAGLTALLALEKGGSLLGRTVLVTGASGGVGHFAIQLAREMGARVVALVRQERHQDVAREAGADEVVVGESAAVAGPYGPFWLILESVGGQVLGEAIGMLAQGGICLSLGISAERDATFDADRFFNTGGARLYGFTIFKEFGLEPASIGLARLLGLVAAGRLRPSISLEAPWTEVASVASQLWERGYPGKAVLDLSS